MSPELVRLRQSLREILAPSVKLPPTPKALIDETEQLRRWLRGDGAARPPKDRMREAIAAFRQTGALATVGEGRLTCFGCVERFTTSQPPLIEDPRAFPRLLSETDKFRREPAFRRCYRGLLEAYFKYEQDRVSEDSPGRRNWLQLRTYLADRVDDIQRQGTQPDWVVAIDQHRNLLTGDPVRRYGNAMLAGDASEFDSVCERAGVDRDSWLRRLVVLAQVRAAVELPDEGFRRHVSPLVSVLGGYPLLKDEGLTLMLDRYSEMSSRPEQNDLRDATIAAWGSPWMRLNNPGWQRVRPESRAMVHAWLNLKLIQKFFDVLSADRSTDQRRVRFWKQYHDQISEIYFALGPTAAYSRSTDIRELKKEMEAEGHLLWLRGGGSDNNAFIMRIGNHVIVEFGLKGNACYIFRANDLPFRLSGEVAGDRTQLKHDSKKEDRLLHVDRALETWEHHFANTLRRLGIQPSSEGRVTGSSHHARQEAGGTRTIRQAGAAPEPYTWTALSRWANAHGFKIEDLVRHGGNIWVVGPLEHGPHTKRLEGWGFRWAERRQAWYRSD